MAKANQKMDPGARAEQPRQTPAATNPHLQDGAVPGPELIAQRAYELYEARGRGEGSDQDDWTEAERQFKGNRGNG